MTSREEHLNKMYTHKELRRAYKLCCLYENENVRKIAQKTLIFVASKNQQDEQIAEECASPWNKDSFSKLWKERLETKIPRNPRADYENWRKHVEFFTQQSERGEPLPFKPVHW